MADLQIKALRAVPLQPAFTLQLLCCHCLIVLAAIISSAQLFAVVITCLFSFLLLLVIPYQMHVLEILLERLERNQSVQNISVRRRWPLTRLFVLARALDERGSERIALERRTAAYHNQLLQQVSKTAAQEERNRLARDLHDSIKQQLFSIVVSAAAVKARWEQNPVSARKVVDDIERTAREAQVEMQALLQQLRPAALENVGLIESLRMQGQALHYRTGADVVTELDNLPPDELFPVGAQETIFRIVQEGFANIARHARASHVWLSLWQQRDAMLIEIGDDGQGFDLAASEKYAGMGLSNVRERIEALGGTASIWSMAGKGTTLNLCIPLLKPQQPADAQGDTVQEIPAVAGKARRTLMPGVRVAELAAASMLLYIPPWLAFWFVPVCLLLAAGAWLWSQQYRLQVSLDLGVRHAQSFLLRAQSYALLSGVLLLGTLYLNYFIVPAHRNAYPVFQRPWQTISTSLIAVLALIIITFYILSLLNMQMHFKLVTLKKQHELVRQQGQQVVIDWLAWGSVTLLAIPLYSWLADILDIRAALNAALLLTAWGIINLVKTLRLVAWQQQFHKHDEALRHQEIGAVR